MKGELKLQNHKIADAHVDVLWRMENERVAFFGESPLQASARKLTAGGVATQVFALYVRPSLSEHAQMESVLRSIDIFYETIVQGKGFAVVRNQAELQQARFHGQLASLLSLEGGGCLRGKPELLRVLHRLGVRGVGLTWNYANALADGCRELRGAGLTDAGRDVVKELQRLGMWIDLSHLADAGVRDVFTLSDGPIMASHSNSRTVHEHPRNLTDEVIREIVRRHGWIGIGFEGSFVAPAGHVSTERVFSHLDHMLELGAEDCIGFGSDFDGANHPVPGLRDAGDYKSFGEQVVERYGDALGGKLLFANFERFLHTVLPKS